MKEFCIECGCSFEHCVCDFELSSLLEEDDEDVDIGTCPVDGMYGVLGTFHHQCGEQFI